MESKKRKVEEAMEDNGKPKLLLEDALKLLEPLSKEQLMDIVGSSLLQHEDVLDKVRSIADQDTNNRKLFVRGLALDTKMEALKAAFAPFGPIQEVTVMKDKSTGKSKGFGFVTFKHSDGALLALKDPSKRVEGRKTVSTIATAGVGASHTYPDQTGRKIYIGNIPLNVPSEKILDLFEQFGEVEEGPLGLDKPAGKGNKRFALIIYKSEEGARRALEEPSKTLDGTNKIFCKYAENTSRQKALGTENSGLSSDPILKHSTPNQYGTALSGLGLADYSRPSSLSSLNPPLSFSQSIGNDNNLTYGGASSYNYADLGSRLGSSRGPQLPYSGGISSSMYGREEATLTSHAGHNTSGPGATHSMGSFYNSEVPRPGDRGPPLSSYYRG